MRSVTPFLWFEADARAALEFYADAFGNDAVIVNDAGGGGSAGTIRIGALELLLFEGAFNRCAHRLGPSTTLRCPNRGEPRWLRT